MWLGALEKCIGSCIKFSSLINKDVNWLFDFPTQKIELGIEYYYMSIAHFKGIEWVSFEIHVNKIMWL